MNWSVAGNLGMLVGLIVIIATAFVVGYKESK